MENGKGELFSDFQSSVFGLTDGLREYPAGHICFIMQ